MASIWLRYGFYLSYRGIIWEYPPGLTWFYDVLKKREEVLFDEEE